MFTIRYRFNLNTYYFINVSFDVNALDDVFSTVALNVTIKRRRWLL